MPQPIIRGYGEQAMPDEFARQLRSLQQQNSPALNQVLVVARRIGWRTTCLASTLGISVAATSKRMERATPASWEVNLREVARDCLHDYREMLPEITEQLGALLEITAQDLDNTDEDLEYLVEVRIGRGSSAEDVLSKSKEAQAALRQQSVGLRAISTPHTRNLGRKIGTLSRRLARADAYSPGDPQRLPGAEDADTIWMRHLQQAAQSCRATLADIPAFEHPNPRLRDEIATALDDLSTVLAGPDADVDTADMATLVVSEKLRLLRLTLPRATDGRARIVRRITTIANRLRLAREYTNEPIVVEGVEIPPPPRVQTMLHGQRLDDETIDRLRDLQLTASEVNGGTRRDSAAWRASQKLSEELDRLNAPTSPTAPRYTAYYLAKVIGITHRAVITRLQRYRRDHGGGPSVVRAGKRLGQAA